MGMSTCATRWNRRWSKSILVDAFGAGAERASPAENLGSRSTPQQAVEDVVGGRPSFERSNVSRFNECHHHPSADISGSLPAPARKISTPLPVDLRTSSTN